MSLITRARAFAHRAHDSIKQVRKYTGEPYWVHTDEVAAIVQESPVGYIDAHAQMVAAAHLHDVLEDVMPLNPYYGPTTIVHEFGSEVYLLVTELTDVYTKVNHPEMNRAARKAAERERIGKTSVAAKTIKLADLISNTRSIVENDPDFARVYIREKMELLPYLVEGDSGLLQRCSTQVMESCGKLGIDIPILGVKI